MKPIIFNTEMVKAILDGRKRQTRKVIMIPSYLYENPMVLEPDCCARFNYGAGGCQNHSSTPLFINSKYRIGDIVYVKETFCLDYIPCMCFYYCNCQPTVVYKADCKDINYKWKPSIHMPKKYARIFLKVTNVRVERLQDIKTEDIIREGYPNVEKVKTFFNLTKELQTIYNLPVINMLITEKATELQDELDLIVCDIKNWWINLWSSTAKDGYKWEDNPYVFVYDFDISEREE